MPIRPIDLQVILPKSQTNPLNREHVVNKEALQLQQMQQANKKQAVEQDKKVNALKHKDAAKVEAKKESDQSGKKQKQTPDKKQAKAPEKENTKEKKLDKPLKFNRFDMKV